MVYRKIFDRSFLVVAIVLMVFFLIPTDTEAARIPDLTAKAAILVDEGSGRILYDRSADQSRPQASLTKIMTALLVLENGDLDKTVIVSKHAEETGESSIWLEEGETFSRDELLYALMLPSANDAAVALAESIAGSEESFAELMNKRARELGLSKTHFMNPHGLHAEEHYTSASDLASLTRAAMQIPKFREVTSTQFMELPWPGHEWERALFNTNKLLTRYQGAMGVKTGYTRQAGCCLTGAAEREGMTLIGVIMDSTDMYGDMEKLLDYGFDNYQVKAIPRKDKTSLVKVNKGASQSVLAELERDVSVVLLPDELSKLTFKTDLVKNVQAPVKKGDILGKAKIVLNGEELEQVNYIAKESVPKKPTLWMTIAGWFASLFS